MAASPASALTIIPVLESSLTGDPNAANIEAQIDTAISTIESLYSTPITVNVQFGTALTGNNFQVAATSYSLIPVSYSQYVALVNAKASADPNNTVLATAVQHINDGNGALQYEGTNKVVAITTANARALGISGYYSDGGTVFHPVGIPQYDAETQFNSAYFSVAATPSGALQAAGVTIVEHELNHVLGVADSILGRGSEASQQYDGAIDLYRYSGEGIGSFDLSANSYFSIDGGKTKIASLTGDGHFDNSTCLIESAIICNTTELYTTASPEYTEMLALGYDPIDSAVGAVPETSTWAMMILGFVALASWRIAGRQSQRRCPCDCER